MHYGIDAELRCLADGLGAQASLVLRIQLAYRHLDGSQPGTYGSEWLRTLCHVDPFSASKDPEARRRLRGPSFAGR